MRNQLIDLDEHQEKLTPELIWCQNVDSVALGTDKVGTPVDVEY